MFILICIGSRLAKGNRFLWDTLEDYDFKLSNKNANSSFPKVPQETVKYDNDSEMTFCIEFNHKNTKNKEKQAGAVLWQTQAKLD